jgi:hypothetical protein
MVNSKEFMVPGESKHVRTMHMGETQNRWANRHSNLKEKVLVCPGFISHTLVQFIQPFKA